MRGLPQKKNARIADKMELFGHLRRYEKIRKDKERDIYNLIQILYLILDYPHKHYTFKHFEV